jgi:hypothetical protein
MDAKTPESTDIKSRLPSRHVAKRPADASHRSCLCATELTFQFDLRAIGLESNIEFFDLFDAAEIFKKTPCVADLKPAGRYVAKDMVEIAGIQLLTNILLDHGHLHGDCLTVTGRTISENLKNVTWNSHQDVFRSADKPITVTGGAVGLKGNFGPEDATVKVAMHRPPVALTGGDIGGKIAQRTDVDPFDVKLTGAELVKRTTKWKPRATNYTTGAPWKDAQQVRPVVDGAVTYPGGAHEKQCHADI